MKITMTKIWLMASILAVLGLAQAQMDSSSQTNPAAQALSMSKQQVFPQR